MADPLTPSSGLSSGPSPTAVLEPGKKAAQEAIVTQQREKEAISSASEKKKTLADKESSGEIYKDLDPIFAKTAEFVKNPQSAPAAPAPKESDPMKAWGSAAMMIAVIGSAFTRTPMATALNAASKAMDAFKQNDTETYEREFKTWQTSMTEYEKVSSQQEKAYQWATQEKDRRKSLNLKEQMQAETELRDKLKSIATTYHDDVMLYTLQQKGIEAAVKLADDRAGLNLRIAENSGKVAEQAETAALIRQVTSDPSYAGLSAAEKRKKLEEVDPRIAAQLTNHERDFIEKTVEKIQASTVGKQYFVLQNADTAVSKAEQEINTAGASAIDGITSNSLIDIYARAIGGGVARRFIVDSLGVKNITYNQKTNELIGKFDQNGGGMSTNQARRLVDAIKEQKQQVEKQYQDQIDSAAANLDHHGGNGDELRKRGGLPTSGGTDRPATGSSTRVPGNVPKAFSSSDTTKSYLARGFGVPEDRVHITSDVRTPKHNKSVGGSKTSEHIPGNGIAYDIKVDGVSPTSVGLKLAAAMIKHNSPFDQILLQPGDVHIGWSNSGTQRIQIGYEGRRGEVTGYVGEKNIRDSFNHGELTQDEANTLLQHYFRKNI